METQRRRDAEDDVNENYICLCGWRGHLHGDWTCPDCDGRNLRTLSGWRAASDFESHIMAFGPFVEAIIAEVRQQQHALFSRDGP